ncbi:HNH endonuclease, partial [Raoultella ornithinolytica]
VDHIKAKAHGGTDDDSNLESLCWPCHRTKTGRERLK